MSRLTRSLPFALLTLALAVPVAAQEELQQTTIAAIERGEAEAMVYLEGAALEQTDDDEFLFSDGTGVITIDVDEDAGEGPPPLFRLVGIDGTVASDEIEVSTWMLLPIVTPAVIVPEEDVVAAFRGWIVAFGSQAPAE